MSGSQEDAGTAAVSASAMAAFAAFNPAIEFDDGDDSDAGDAVGAVEDPGQSSTPDSGGGAEDGGGDHHNRFGYVPCYRTFQGRWFWEEKPWDTAHLFMELLLRANRAERRVKIGFDLIEIGRGMLATSYSKLSEDTGRDRKTLRRWLKLLADDGEVEVQNKGQHGIVIIMLKYDAYALDERHDGPQAGQAEGRPHARRKGQHRARGRTTQGTVTGQ